MVRAAGLLGLAAIMFYVSGEVRAFIVLTMLLTLMILRN